MHLVASEELDRIRINPPELPRTYPGDMYGMFMTLDEVKFPGLRIMSSGNNDIYWEHVSVSLADRCPTWDEMCFVKDLFWPDTETVIQFHPKRSHYKNDHPYCLHLWKRRGVDYELPPIGAV